MSLHTVLVLVLAALTSVVVAERIDNVYMACFALGLMLIPGVALAIQSEVK